MKGYSKPFNDEELDKLQILKIYNNNASVNLLFILDCFNWLEFSKFTSRIKTSLT